MKDLTHLLQDLELSSIWKPETVEQQPVTSLMQWRVFKVNSTIEDRGFTLHFVGNTGREGRVSSDIKSYDPETCKGISASNRIYELLGPSGTNSDAMYVWSKWMQINGYPETVDVTEKFKPKADPAKI